MSGPGKAPAQRIAGRSSERKASSLYVKSITVSPLLLGPFGLLALHPAIRLTILKGKNSRYSKALAHQRLHNVSDGKEAALKYFSRSALRKRVVT